MKRRGSSSIGSYLPFLFFVIFLGVVAIGGGYFLGKFFTSSLSSLRTPPKEPAQGQQKPAQSATIQVRGMNLFRVQAGVFNVKENAERMVADLKKAGIPSTISGNAPYRVVVALLPSLDSANKVAQSVRAKGFEAAVAKYDIQAKSFNVTAGQDYIDAVKPAIETASVAMERSLTAVDYFIMGKNTDAKGILDSVSAVNEAKQKIEAAGTPAAAEGVHSSLQGMLGAAGQALQSLTVAASSGNPGPAVLGDVTGAVLEFEKAAAGFPSD